VNKKYVTKDSTVVVKIEKLGIITNSITSQNGQQAMTFEKNYSHLFSTASTP
jgi:hypothetical protein